MVWRGLALQVLLVEASGAQSVGRPPLIGNLKCLHVLRDSRREVPTRFERL